MTANKELMKQAESDPNLVVGLLPVREKMEKVIKQLHLLIDAHGEQRDELNDFLQLLGNQIEEATKRLDESNNQAAGRIENSSTDAAKRIERATTSAVAKIEATCKQLSAEFQSSLNASINWELVRIQTSAQQSLQAAETTVSRWQDVEKNFFWWVVTISVFVGGAMAILLKFIL